MSSALVRQALEFVDQEVGGGKTGKRRKRAPKPWHRLPEAALEHGHPYGHNKKPVRESVQPEPCQRVEENVKKLLALSRPTADRAVTEKIIERAIKGTPLLEKIEIKTEKEKSILFPEEESFKKFEKEYFCS